MRRLTEMELAFISAMEADPSNQMEAARKAGYKQPRIKASQLMAKPKIAEEVERRLRARRKDFGIDTQEAVKHLAEIAMFDPIALVNNDGSPKDLRDMPPEVRRAVKDIEFRPVHDKDGKVKRWQVRVTECYGKLSAWEQIAKLLGLNRERPVVNQFAGDQNVQANVLVLTDEQRIQALRSIVSAAQRGGATRDARQRIAELGGNGLGPDSPRQGDAIGPVLGGARAADGGRGDAAGPVAEGLPAEPGGQDSAPLF